MASYFDHAEKLLKDTDKTIEEISGLSGFGHVRTFYLAFEKKNGVSATEWRNG